ncbi:hypothetical protein D3C72_2293670 [compost metagenome]
MLTSRPATARSTPTSAPPVDIVDPVTAVNVLVLFCPMLTLPLMVPALTKLLPVADRPSPTRPLMTPPAALFTVTGAPP